MFFRSKRTIKLGVKSLWMHKLRSTLTALGIIFGVSSVIAMLAIGEGASQDAQEKIAQLGSNNIIIKTVGFLQLDGIFRQTNHPAVNSRLSKNMGLLMPMPSVSVTVYPMSRLSCRTGVYLSRRSIVLTELQ